MNVRSGAQSRDGVTLIEILIASLMIGMVFLAAMSVYMSGFKMLQRQSTTGDPTRNAVVIMEELTKRISECNDVVLDGPNQTLHLRCDYLIDTHTLNNAPFGTPSNFADDKYWHFRFLGTDLIYISDAINNTVPGAGTVLLPNVNNANSSFTLTSASSIGSATKVDIILETTTPVQRVQSGAFLGAKATR